MKHVNAIESRIITRLIDKLLEDGLQLGIADEEEPVCAIGSSRQVLIESIGHTDMTYIQAFVNDEKAWIMLVHGNNEDVISDYTLNISDNIGDINNYVFG